MGSAYRIVLLLSFLALGQAANKASKVTLTLDKPLSPARRSEFVLVRKNLATLWGIETFAIKRIVTTSSTQLIVIVIETKETSLEQIVNAIKADTSFEGSQGPYKIEGVSTEPLTVADYVPPGGTTPAGGASAASGATTLAGGATTPSDGASVASGATTAAGGATTAAGGATTGGAPTGAMTTGGATTGGATAGGATTGAMTTAGGTTGAVTTADPAATTGAVTTGGGDTTVGGTTPPPATVTYKVSFDKKYKLCTNWDTDMQAAFATLGGFDESVIVSMAYLANAQTDAAMIVISQESAALVSALTPKEGTTITVCKADGPSTDLVFKSIAPYSLL